MLLRRFVNATFRLLQRSGWKIENIDTVNRILQGEPAQGKSKGRAGPLEYVVTSHSISHHAASPSSPRISCHILIEQLHQPPDPNLPLNPSFRLVHDRAQSRPLFHPLFPLLFFLYPLPADIAPRTILHPRRPDTHTGRIHPSDGYPLLAPSTSTHYCRWHCRRSAIEQKAEDSKWRGGGRRRGVRSDSGVLRTGRGCGAKGGSVEESLQRRCG